MALKNVAYAPVPEKAEGLKEFLLDLGSRKEFGSLREPSEPFPGHTGLRLLGAQLFVQGFQSPNTPYTRLLLNWQTGSGKTVAAISIAQKFIASFKTRSASPDTHPTVFVISFTKKIFQADLLKYPEFGYISVREIEELRRLRTLAVTQGGDSALRFSASVGVLRRRITDRARGGYYKFYGYKKFANELFQLTPKGAREKFSPAKLFAARGDGENATEEATVQGTVEGAPTVQVVEEAVKKGLVVVNTGLLASLERGLIISDEIHNTYNVKAKNNYGLALQYVFNTIPADRAPRALFMSATVAGGSAAEVVDVLNLLTPREYLPGGKLLRREDFFQKTAEIALRPGALDRIGRLSAGRVSFLIGAGARPRRVFEGVPMDDPATGAPIAYLRFTPCPMSAFHFSTLAAAAGDAGTLPPNARALYDMAYPNPAFSPTAALCRGGCGGAEGLYLSDETPAKLAGADTSWRAAAGVVVTSLKGGALKAGSPALISGDFLSLAPGRRAGVASYSGKYARIAADVVKILQEGPGKIMIYHHYVRMSGVLQIMELLKANGFLDEKDSAPRPSTLCAVCGVPKAKHGAKKHAYTPARFVIVNSEVDKTAIAKSLDNFNAPSNAEGYSYRVLIGSKIIREGFDLKAVRFQLIASLPTDISTLVQVLGRAVRTNSHVDLPEDQRDVRVRIYVSVPPDGSRELSLDLKRYAKKMRAYFVIQEVEKALRRYAVDAFMDRRAVETPSLEAIPYTPVVTRKDVDALPTKTSTFYAYNYGIREIEMVAAALRALFRETPVWTYGELWDGVRDARFLPVDPKTLSEESFAAALDVLCARAGNVVRPEASSPSLVARVGGFFVAVPADSAGRPILDVETYLRDPAVTQGVSVRVADYVGGVKQEKNFKVRLAQFEERYGDEGRPIELMFAEYDADFHYELCRRLVEASHAATGASGMPARLGVKNSALARALGAYLDYHVILPGRWIAKNLQRGRLPPGRPAAYVTSESVRVLSPPRGWYDVPRSAAGIGTRYDENPVVVGYVKRRGPHLRFKVRAPLQELTAKKAGDIRTVARGAVCQTRDRREQESIARRLGIPTAGGEMCQKILVALLKRERAARSKGMEKGVRWFYLFNDPQPTIAPK